MNNKLLYKLIQVNRLIVDECNLSSLNVWIKSLDESLDLDESWMNIILFDI